MRYHLIVAYWDWHAPFIKKECANVLYCNRLRLDLPGGKSKSFNRLIFDFLPRVLNRLGLNRAAGLIYEIHGTLVVRALREHWSSISSAHIWVGFSLRLTHFVSRQQGIWLTIERSGSWPRYQRELVYHEKAVHGLGSLPPQDKLPVHRIKKMEAEFECANTILLCSETSKSTFPSKFLPKCQVISLGSNFSVLPSRFSVTRNNEILMVSGASLRKGLHYLESFQCYKATLVMTPSLMRNELQRQWSGDNVLFLNTMPRHKLINLYRKHKWFLFPSVEDGFGMVVLEAIAQGCIPFVSKYAGVSELFTSGLPELVFDPRSKVDVSRVFTLMRDPQFYDDIVDRCKSLVMTDWGAYVEVYTRLACRSSEEIA